MDEAALFGGVLFQAPEPVAAAEVLEEYLTSSEHDYESDLRSCGIEPALADALRGVLSKEPAAVHVACARGAAWVLGYRSAQRNDSWELVASVPIGTQLPAGVRRATAETLIGLVADSQRSVRIAAPYVDPSGLELLSDSLAGATLRGVAIEVFESRNWQPGTEAVRVLRQYIDLTGDPKLLRVSRISRDIAVAHLKVVIADESAAYIGSANITGAGLRGRNAELGVLLHGPEVATVGALLDTYRST